MEVVESMDASVDPTAQFTQAWMVAWELSQHILNNGVPRIENCICMQVGFVSTSKIARQIWYATM